MDIKQAATEYLKSIKRLTDGTRRGYEQRLGVFIEWCVEHNIELAEIRNVAVDDFVEYLRAHHHSAYHSRSEVSTHTLAGYVRVIKVFLAYCLEDEKISQQVSESAVRRIKLPKRTKNIVQIFSEQDIQALFKACNQEFDVHLQERDRAILSVLLDTGVRAAELCGLTIEHAHLEADDPHIKVLGKGSKWREVGLGKLSREALQYYITTYRADAVATSKVFIGRYNEPLTVSGLEKLIMRLGKFAAITNVRCSPHSFRHTFAVKYLLAGGDVFKLSLLMGHEDTRITTTHYLRTVQSMQIRRDARSVLDEMQIS